MTQNQEQSIFSEKVKELVALGAAIGSNCEPCFKYHFAAARKLGVSKEDIRLAVDMAEAVKESPARSISALAEKFLNDPNSEIATGGCCAPTNTADSGSKKSNKCCG